MPVLQIEAQLTTGQLLKAVEQMPQPELDRFVERVVALRARQRAVGSEEAPSGSARDAEVGRAGGSRPPAMAPSADPREKELEELYEKIANFRSRENGGAGADGAGAESEEELRATFERLRHLQSQEAAEFRAAAESRLLMPLGAGRKVLDEIDQLLDEG